MSLYEVVIEVFVGDVLGLEGGGFAGMLDGMKMQIFALQGISYESSWSTSTAMGISAHPVSFTWPG